MIELYTDGSCLKNPNGPGGWAVCFIEDDNEYYLSGNNSCTTNNRMELTAIIEAISLVEDDIKECKIYTDSQLCINCANRKWKRKSNLDLWEIYDKVSKNKKINFEWVKGHSGNKYNEIVDKLAFNEAKDIKI
jgi:ribonuclease HI